MNVLEWLGNLFNKCGAWLGQQVADGSKWVVEKSIGGIFFTIGESCRFMTIECSEAFVLFGIIGVFFIMANFKETGTKMINLSILVFIIMKVLGVCM